MEREKVIDDSMIYGKIYKLYKSYLLMVSDHEEMGIGNVLLSNPPIIEGIKASVASYALFGLGDDMLGKIIVEKAALYLKTSVILLFFIKTRKFDENFIKAMMEFLNGILKEIDPTNKG